MSGGTEEFYLDVLSVFYEDAKERLPLIRKAQESGDLSAIGFHAHALKGALASIGATEISAEATRLEAAGKTNDLSLAEEIMPGFFEQLSQLIEKIYSIIDIKKL